MQRDSKKVSAVHNLLMSQSSQLKSPTAETSRQSEAIAVLSKPKASASMSVAQQLQIKRVQEAAIAAQQGRPPGNPPDSPTDADSQPDSPPSGDGGRRLKRRMEERGTPSEELSVLRKRICMRKLDALRILTEVCYDSMRELFFLQKGFNLMDNYFTWKKKANPELQAFLITSNFDSDEELSDDDRPLICETAKSPMDTSILSAAVSPVGSPQPMSQPLTPQILLPGGVIACKPAAAAADSPQSPLSRAMLTKLNRTLSPPRHATRQQALSSVIDQSTGASTDAIVERAKQEAQVLQRVAELRKDGMWSAKRLPKVREPPRSKAHWDYLLEEIQWLATDFVQERKWKKAAAKKISTAILRYHKEKELKVQSAEKDEYKRLRRIASNIAKDVRQFWSNIEKVVHYKQQSRFDEQRKKALDMHLNFIVDQTEKYSTWLTEGLRNDNTPPMSPASPKMSSQQESILADDEDFQYESGESADDEETIAKAELEDDVDPMDELDALQRESEMPIEDLISTLPAEMLDPNAPPLRPGKGKPEDEGSESESDDSAATGRSLTTLMEGAGQESRKRKRDEDSDYTASQSEEEESDDERTIEKEERIAAGQDDAVDEELSDLKNEGDMSIDELYAKYAAAYDEDFEMPVSESEVTTSEDQSEEEQASSEEEEEEEEEESDDPEEQEEIGMEYLLSPKPEPPTDELPKNKDPRSPNRDITDIAAAAQSLQPTGYTLETTKVKTPVPFLLRHQLREYQHVGLEWLVTMYDSKLNGILADEMGLGKTIQTIATLAHLACEKGVWGPHLVVTPTSVMLNWEMEFKKWSPGFKILTYYGTPKERRMKRQGWTKVNAFHVCITSYKIVIQDHAAFRRKKWKYLILDEAQNIKNFKSQRWQTLLNFQSQRRLLLTGTPLQNSLMELWSLMHFLMPHVFASHREFRDWFSNPLQNMVEGSQEFNESLVRRLHKVLRPFILRRLKLDVEKQMPKKYEHVIMCRLSKRQRFLYDEFMHQTKTRETLASGSFMGVINILMQLRKVCNHPDLFDPRPVVSPLVSEGLVYHTPALVLQALRYDPLKDFNPEAFQLNLALHEQTCSSLNAKRWNQLKAPRRLIEEIDSMPEPPKRPRPIKLKFNLKEPAAPPGQVPVAQQMPLPGQTANPRPSIASIAQSLKLGVPATTEAATPPATQTLSAPVTPTSQSLSQSLSFNIQGNRFIIPQHQLKNLPPNIVHLLQSSAGSQLIAKTAGAAGPSLGGAQVIVGTTTSSAVATALTAATLTTVAQAPPKVTTSVSTVPASSPRPAAPIQRPATAVTLPTVSSSVPTQVKPVVRVAPMSGGAGLAPVRPEHPPASMQQQQPSQHPAARSETPSAAAATTSSAPVPMDVTPAARAFASAYVNRPPRTEYYIDRIAQRQEEARRQKLSRLADLNEQRCSVEPVFGYDLVHTVQQLLEPCVQCQAERTTWLSAGFAACKRVQTMRSQQRDDWNHTSLLDELVPTNEIVLNRMKDTTDRFVMYNPKAITPAPRLHCSRLISEQQSNELRRSQLLAHEVSPRMAPYHSLSNGMLTQFPDKRLIQYDCGKLQTMDILLRQLKSEAHRVLIFTQMSRMLDILETFLNYHGHTYVRLDGTTKVEQRQMLMDRFNNDRRIFVFILSTRSGGIGVNLTGADTVIFYDSDWNPTMDAQAQDRCHRIGQTRDVHIYRLISERSVEENILKKANQKRLLGDMAIEGGNFTTAYFKKHSINELFDQPTGLDELAKEKALQQQQQQRPSEETATVPAVTQTMFEAALAGAEEETDVLATRNLTAEVKAELAEFDENIPWEEDAAAAAAAAAATAAGGAPSTSTADPVTSAPPPSKVEELPEISRVEQELAMLDNELTPIERYAVCYIESQMGPVEEDDMQLAEEELENAKREWELGRLQQIKEEEEFRAEYEEDEILFTYSNEDAKNQVTKKARPKGRPPLQAGAKGPTLAGAGARRRADRDDEPGEIDIMSADDSLAATGTNPRLHRGPAAFGTPPIGARARVQTPRRLSSEPNGLANETSPSPRSIGALGGPRWNKFSGEAALKRPRGRPRLVRRSEEDTGDLSPEALPKSPPAQAARPPVSSPASAPQAWSNPNLVIRTRRARLSQSAAGDTP